MCQFLETRDHNYCDLILEFLGTLHVEVMRYISFYLNMELYELNLGAFNSIFDFPPSMDLPYRHVLKNFNSNAFWNEISGDYRYDTYNSKRPLLETPILEGPKDYLLVVCLLGKIV